jgi:hypothetical protein
MGSFSTIGSPRLLSATLAALVAMAAIADNAAARVGVTSGTDGDPLGKPPNENERVLRIGIDVQANELVTTNAVDRAHLVFLDGSSLTVGPNARITIDKFVYNPSTQTGELAINASKGVLRLVGGRISKTTPITITTPSSTIGIRGGITIVSITQVQTIANFVFGNSMTVTAAGQTQTATRAGSQVVTAAGGAPAAPALLKPGSLTAALAQLEGASSNSNTGADQSAQKSGFSNQNSGQPANTPANLNLPPNPTNNALTNAVSNTNPAGQPVGNSTPQNQNATAIVTGPTNTPGNAPNTPPPNMPPPTGPTRTSQTLTGFSTGLVVTTQENSNFSNGSTRVRILRQGTVSITTDAANDQARATVEVNGLRNSHHHSSSTAKLELGPQHGAFADDKNYGIIKLPTDTSPQSTFQRSNNAPQPINDASFLASVAATPGCTCEYLSWGQWASAIPDPNHPGRTYEAWGTYVAGKPPMAVQLPTMGSATYTGFMAGFAQSGGNNPYAATGTYQNTWDFAGRTGVFNGTFDGRSYSGNTTGAAGSTIFTGNFIGGNRTGGLNGGFFASPTDPAKYQAGTFSIGNSHSYYRASGVFAGQR